MGKTHKKGEKIYSFDVFDTCLARISGEPKYLFDILSWKVIQTIGINPYEQEYLRQLFVATRIECGGAGSLIDIYENVKRLFPLPLTSTEMANMEMEMESEVLVPIKATLDLIREKRSDGRIMFITDMYLPTDFIRNQLQRHGFYQNEDSLYVSNDVGYAKRDGKLFQYIHEHENIPYRKWYHYGDARKSDYSIPKKLGINAHKINYKYLSYEKKWIDKIPSTQFQYSAITAGISRAIRLQYGGNSDLCKFVSDISAPLMVSWVIEVMKNATKAGISRLFFMARDTHSEYIIAKSLSKYYPHIECKYLFASRESLLSPLALKYFESVGLASTTVKTAIVDTNSTGHSSEIINNLFTTNHYLPTHTFLFNYANLYGSTIKLESQIHTEISEYYSSNMCPIQIAKVPKVRIYIELLFPLNFHKKTVGYEYHGNRIRPIFSNDSTDNVSVPHFQSLKRENDFLLSSWSSAFMTTYMHHYSHEILHSLAIPNLGEFVLAPRKEYIYYLNQFVLNGEKYVCKLTPHNILKKKYIWLLGSIVFTLPDTLGKILCKAIRSKAFFRIKKILGKTLHIKF